MIRRIATTASRSCHCRAALLTSGRFAATAGPPLPPSGAVPFTKHPAPTPPVSIATGPTEIHIKDGHESQGADSEEAQLEARRQLLKELQEFKSGHGLKPHQVRRIDDLIDALTNEEYALEEGDQENLSDAFFFCNKTFYRRSFKDNAQRDALLDLLFKIHNAVQPALDERRQELLAQLHLHIREDVAVEELLALDAALRLRTSDASAEQEAIAECNKTFYRRDFKENAHRSALLDLLFKIHNDVQPPRDERRGELLVQLHRHIRESVAINEGVAVKELIAMDAAIRRNNEAGERIACDDCLAVVIDNTDDETLFSLVLNIRNTLQPPRPEFAKFVEPLYKLMRKYKQGKQVRAALRAIDEEIRLDQRDDSNKKQLIAALNTAFRAGCASSACGDFFSLILKVRNAVQPPQPEFAELVPKLDQLICEAKDDEVAESLCAVDAALRLDESEPSHQERIAAINTAFQAGRASSACDGFFAQLLDVRNVVQPPQTKFAELVPKLDQLIRVAKDDKVADSLRAVDAALRLDESEPSHQERIAAINTAFQAGRASSACDGFFAQLLDVRNVVQPPKTKFAELVPKLDQLIRVAKDDKVADSLRAVDATLRLDESEPSHQERIAAINTAFKVATAAKCGSEFCNLLIGIRKDFHHKGGRVGVEFVDRLYSHLGDVQGGVLAVILNDIDAALDVPLTDNGPLSGRLFKAVSSCIATLLGDAFKAAPNRKRILQLAFDIDAKVCLFPSERVAAADALARRIGDAGDSGLASELGWLRAALRHRSSQKTLDLIAECERAGARGDLMEQVRRCLNEDWLQSLKAAAAAQSMRDTHFPDYFEHLLDDKVVEVRPVVFLAKEYRIAVEDRAVRIKFQRDMVKIQQQEGSSTWKQLVAITGPSGCGKTIMGLFGLAGKRQVLVYVGKPPELADDRESIVGDVRASNEVRKKGKEARALPPSDTRRRVLLRDALGQHLLEKLTSIFGERPGLQKEDYTDVIFFFDELGGADENSADVRVGVCELAKALATNEEAPFAFGDDLKTKLGLKVRGFAIGGTGLDAELAMGSLGEPDACRTVTPNCDGLTWRDFDQTVDEQSSCTPGERAALDAALRLPRLAALVLRRASAKTVGCRIPMKLLHNSVGVAVDDFMRLNALCGMVAGRGAMQECERAESRMRVTQHCFELLFSPPTCSVRELSAYTRYVISRLGLVTVLPETEVEGPARLHIGPGQRLVLRLFALEDHMPSSAGFERRVADFLCLAVAASQGRTLSEFVGALNRFFSHEHQHPNTCATNAPPRTRDVAAPEGMEGHVLAADRAAVWSLRWKVAAGDVSAGVSEMTKGFKVKPDQCTVLVNGDGDGAAASWDLQLVLPVIDAATARKVKREKWTRSTELRHVTFDLKAYVDAALSGPELELDRPRMAGVPRTALPRKARDGGLIAVVGRPLREATTEGAAGVPVWHVNVADPGSLGVVPFCVLDTTDDADAGSAFVEEWFVTRVL